MKWQAKILVSSNEKKLSCGLWFLQIFRRPRFETAEIRSSRSMSRRFVHVAYACALLPLAWCWPSHDDEPRLKVAARPCPIDVPMVVISMPASTGRRDTLRHELARLGCDPSKAATFVMPIDVKIEAAVRDWSMLGLVGTGPNPTSTCIAPPCRPSGDMEVAITLSHLKATRVALALADATPARAVLVLEDDVDLGPAARWDFNLSEWLARMPDGWSFVQLGSTLNEPADWAFFSQTALEHVAPWPGVYGGIGGPQTNRSCTVLPGVWGLFATVYSRSGLQRIAEEACPRDRCPEVRRGHDGAGEAARKPVRFSITGSTFVDRAGEERLVVSENFILAHLLYDPARWRAWTAMPPLLLHHHDVKSIRTSVLKELAANKDRVTKSAIGSNAERSRRMSQKASYFAGLAMEAELSFTKAVGDAGAPRTHNARLHQMIQKLDAPSPLKQVHHTTYKRRPIDRNMLVAGAMCGQLWLEQNRARERALTTPEAPPMPAALLEPREPTLAGRRVPPAAPRSHGIAMPIGRSDDVAMGIASIQSLRADLGCRLPLEVWHADELAPAAIALLRDLGASVSRIEGIGLAGTTGTASHYRRSLNDARHFQSFGAIIKPLVLLQSRFDVVVLVEADVLFFQSPAKLLSHPSLLETGAFGFPDFVHNVWCPQKWRFSSEAKGEALQNRAREVNILAMLYAIAERTENRSTYTRIRERSNLVAKSPWYNAASCHHQDSAVLVVDKGRSAAWLRALSRWATNLSTWHAARMDSLSYGDKESYWLAAEVSRQPFAFSPLCAARIGMFQREAGARRSRLVTEFGPDGPLGSTSMIAHYDPTSASPETASLLWADLKGAYPASSFAQQMVVSPAQLMGSHAREGCTSIEPEGLPLRRGPPYPRHFTERQIGLLANRDRRVAHLMPASRSLVVGENLCEEGRVVVARIAGPGKALLCWPRCTSGSPRSAIRDCKRAGDSDSTWRALANAPRCRKPLDTMCVLPWEGDPPRSRGKWATSRPGASAEARHSCLHSA